MRIEPLGDLAYILRDLGSSPAAIAQSIEAANLAGVTDIVPCAETVGVYFQTPIARADLEAACEEASANPFQPREHRIPICYEIGEDLSRVARSLRLTESDFVHIHSSGTYSCFAIGFCPGFAYLGPVPEPLREVPRLSSPRSRTAAGSLGITGNQTAVYPMIRPGGWPIVGMTPLVLVDPADDYFPISVGDRVRFEPISSPEFERLKGQRL